ncbi:unnamed protein product [Ilex paraguariensis]|uniref:Acetylajmalan esterase n=1 Tax=Ilex paraguariensis TaxID=185542 RepID=A0ABC8TZX4_9AQUA
MASAIFCIVPILFSLLLLPCEAHVIIHPFEYIYQLGDSLADTGNLICQSATTGKTPAAAHLPYGESFRGGPTGRCSNGLLIIDFVAIALSLPLLNPYLDSNATFDHGANFAVAGSTALDYTFFTTKGVYNPSTNISLGDQLNWFKSHLNTICLTPAECKEVLSKALVFVGEIGGNDVNHPLIQGKSIQEIYTYLPYTIEAITNAIRVSFYMIIIKEVIHLGAVNIVVPGNVPIGCLPVGLTVVSGGNETAYDDMGCSKELNELALVQNNYLQESLSLLRQEFSHADIIYADYYTAYKTILYGAADFGFDEKSLLKSCCGIGGLYNYDHNRECGSRGVPVCRNPTQYISWDGIHLTQEAYRHITEILLPDILPGIRYI